jgi:anti-anti-sigma factor
MTSIELYQRLEQGAAVIQLTRPLTRTHYADLPQYVAGVLADDVRAALLDLHAVDFADSTGISALLGARKAADAAHKPLILCNVSDYFLNIINMLNLSDVFTVRESVQSALRELEDQA